MGVNKFTDFNSYHMKNYFGYNHKMSAAMRARYPQTNKTHFHSIKLRDLPASVDWRNSSIVTDVKDQEMCGSCWAFAATECIESAVAQATGQLLILSEQNMVDCTPNPSKCGGSGGCEGATAELGYSYVISNGIASEDDYPYKGVDGNCDESIPKSASITSFVMLPQNDYHALMVAVATIGPIAVTVAASPWSLYSSGVFKGCPKPGQDVDLNHGVQLVGYGTDPDEGDYWLVRNSWGTGWGEDGYIRLERHSDGSSTWCSPDNEPLDGDGCPGGPSPITVCGSCGIWYDSAYPVAGGFTRK
jgi:cathepsin L